MAIGNRIPPYMGCALLTYKGSNLRGITHPTNICDGGLSMISETSVYDSYSYPPRSNYALSHWFL